ncbi:PDZ domain-containing protein [Luteolibacter yonseiensis]|uniref:PDZ domain-containing protein n=1 Tax=Luteolibacter yonseiensis TaxID=1144680 RepID=A0A934R390_9BACT|nr:PDZ domain-containing protein [Luteolibacter yonseiensis]MBK1814429.1 PDZ domain-containing protein [Luteolibacter yonseiensis]
MKPIAYFIVASALANVAFADDEVPLLLPEERRVVEAQSDEFSEAIKPALADAAKSTVRVWAGSRRVAYGTVVGDGTKILSKWSEIASSKGKLRVDVAGNQYRDVTLGGVYQDEDLVLLNVEGSALKPVTWSFESPKIGGFLAAPQPDGNLAAFGVVSVLERNLRDTDMAFLGVRGDPEFKGAGVKIWTVEEKSGAFDAGLVSGDVILKVGDRVISGMLELKNALSGTTPGSTVDLLVDSQGRAKTVKVVLGNRTANMAQYGGQRLQVMERMGGALSQVRGSFTHALQTDMRPKPNQIGGPVVDLEGRVLGITLARADRTRSFVMPAAAVDAMLKKPAQDPSVAQVRTEEIQGNGLLSGSEAPRPQRMRGGENRARRHLSDMRRLMDHMRDEMDALEGR